ncbi:HAD family hydrolase [Enterococcus saccharolyticus]|uniref:HAD family hydrolase n=1 Tax=Enterococcus saccharolyticus TaxID=41997 RepID=UPI0039DFA5A9
MRALIFDVDDTLYDQLVPFERAIQEQLVFPAEKMEKLYLEFRKVSDAYFHLSESGGIAMEDMRVLRIQRACEQFDIELSHQQALAFQADYASFQGDIELTVDMKEALQFCQEENIPTGVITNGPTAHQWKKVHQLGLMKWIPENQIFISSQVGIAKPDVRLFRHVEQAMSLVPEETTYIGDSYANDIVGAKDAGWQAIWLNRRQHPATEMTPRQDYLLEEKQFATPLIKKIFLN